jgi:hypothetical protein
VVSQAVVTVFDERIGFISTINMGGAKMDVVRSSETLKMEAIRSSETLVTTSETTWRHNPEEHHQYLYRRENLTFQTGESSGDGGNSLHNL